MNLLRRAILAFALIAGIAPAIAQVPPPVPGLPDTERRTAYSISASTCACAVNMALYGDSTDFQNWVEVFINGVRANYSDPDVGWAITSPSGSLATLARPITDAVLTFNQPQTGTIQIVGARRPRRISQFNENAGVPARAFNQVLTDIIAQNREIWDKTNDMTGRGIFSQPGNIMGLLPLPAACQGSLLGFDSTGLNPICMPFIGTTPVVVTPCNANTVVAGPTSGPPAVPGCRSLVSADIPGTNQNQRLITAPSPVTIGTTDDQVLIELASPTAVTVNLPAASTRNARPVVIKDFAGNAAVFNITIVPNGAETIDGASTLVIQFNKASYTLVPVSGVGWAII